MKSAIVFAVLCAVGPLGCLIMDGSGPEAAVWLPRHPFLRDYFLVGALCFAIALGVKYLDSEK